MKRSRWTEGWRLNVALTAGVMATVLMALIMAQLDALQAQRPAHDRLVIANIQATAVAEGSPILLPGGSVSVNSAPAAPVAGGPVVPDVDPRSDDQPGGAPELPVCGEVPSGWLLYTVAEGDTIAGLAAATGADPAALLAANCLAGDGLGAGMQILLPSEPATVPPCGPPQWWVRYQVRAGDTMAALARSRNTTVAEVLLANCRDSEALSAGQLIFLPPGGPAPAIPPTSAPPPVVQPPAPTATPVVSSPTAPPPTTAPTNPPPTAVPPTVVLPTIPPVPTRVAPTSTAAPGPTATPPVVPPTAPPPTAPPPTAPPPTAPPPTIPPPTIAPPTRVPPTATIPPPTLPPPTRVPPTEPPPTQPPPPTDTPVPPPTDTPIPPPTETPEPAPAPTGATEPAWLVAWYRSFVWQRYWR